MPKKTAYSRSGAQRNSSRPKQKSFELVRPVPNEEVYEKAEGSEEADAEDEVAEIEAPEETEEIEERVSGKERVQVTKQASAKESVPAAAPTSVAARLAARRQAAQKEKAQRPSANLIMAENYAYVRKDLVFILILAIILFATIITLHFVPAIGG